MAEAPTFGITGATGAVGGRVATRLAELGYSQRLIVCDLDRAPDLPAAEAAEASYDDPRAMRRNLSGVRTFFMVSAGEAYDRLRQHIDAIDAAVAAGVERIVYLSFIGAAPAPGSVGDLTGRPWPPSRTSPCA